MLLEEIVEDIPNSKYMRTIDADIINSNKMLEQARKLHDNAKDGTLKIGKDKYDFKFDRREGLYRIYKNGIEHDFSRINTRILGTAKKWLQEYLTT